MAITKSFNKHTQTYYVYDTSYVWDEAKQKKVQKRQCIGKWDPVTEKIIPTGKRGRPSRFDANIGQTEKTSNRPGGDSRNLQLAKLFNSIATNLNIIQSVLSDLASDFKTASEYFSYGAVGGQSSSDTDAQDECSAAEIG